ncbi:MAG: acyl-CoA thioesterase [Phycisphaerales bacterium]|nr:acyl-CoA thioesterase [Phycisphaerales bacterium]
MGPAFRQKRRIQFAETDLAGVLHFSNYFRLMEEIEHAFFRSLGTCVISEADGVTVSWPRVAAECEYRAPLRFEDEVELRLILTHVGNKALSYDVEFVLGNEVAATGKITAICCATGPNGDFKSMRIPEALRARLAGRG